MNLLFHQAEGICTENGLKYYVSNENKASNPQQLHTFDLSNFLNVYLKNLVTNTTFSKVQNEISIFPNPAKEFVTIKINNELLNTSCIITDISGKNMLNIQLNEKTTTISLKSLPAGMYIIHVSGDESFYSLIKN